MSKNVFCTHGYLERWIGFKVLSKICSVSRLWFHKVILVDLFILLVFIVLYCLLALIIVRVCHLLLLLLIIVFLFLNVVIIRICRRLWGPWRIWCDRWSSRWLLLIFDPPVLGEVWDAVDELLILVPLLLPLLGAVLRLPHHDALQDRLVFLRHPQQLPLTLLSVQTLIFVIISIVYSSARSHNVW